MIRLLPILLALAVSGCAPPVKSDPPPTTPPEDTAPQGEPIVNALEALRAQLGRVEFNAVGALMMVSGFNASVMLGQDESETVIAFFPSKEEPLRSDMVVCVFDTDTTVLLEARLFRLGLLVEIELDTSEAGAVR